MSGKMKDKVLVSVICNTYNHEKYIEKTLEGFISQNTTFRFEVLIHDDASTDSTPQIIRKYVEKYPDLILPIYQKENQYSQGVDFVGKFQYPRCKGKYFAICEGDDFWIDPYKLQKQVDYLEHHSNIYACVSGAIVHDVKLDKNKYYLINRHSGILSAKQILMAGGELVPTCSLLLRKEVCLNMPEEFRISYAGDLQLPIYAMMLGGVYAFSEYQCQYNINVSGSWTDRESKEKTSIQVNHMNELISFYEKINLYSNFKYNEILKHKISNLYAKRFIRFRVLPDDCFELKNCSLKFKLAYLYMRILFRYGKK